jgi:hypothetical protein
LAIPLASASATPYAMAHSDDGPLQIASQQLSGWHYSLESLASCRLSDGVAIFKNVSSDPIRVTLVSLLTEGGGAALAPHRWTYELLQFREGSTTGELAGSADLTALRHGRSLGTAVGSVIEPVRSGSWYDVVARIRMPAGQTSAWGIHGIVISYRVDSKEFSSSFRQSIRLPATSHCN